MAEKAQWYLGLFKDSADLPARGDGSPYYSMCGLYPGTAQRIHEFNADARIIYMVRHPLRRIESAWVNLLSVGDFNAVSDAGSSPFTLTDKQMGFDHTLYKTEVLIDPSLYWNQLSEYRRYFPDEQIRIGFFEEFIADEGAELRACLSFLGVDPSIDIDIRDEEDRNSSKNMRQRLAVVDAIRKHAVGYERVQRFIPQSLKTLFTDRITRPIPMTSPWTAESVEWTVSRIADDSAALLRYAGRSEDYWQLR